MTATSNLRAQAAEFLSQGERSAISGSNTTIPTRNGTPVPASAPRAVSTAASETGSDDTTSTGTAGHEGIHKMNAVPAHSDDKTTARVASDNRGSFSTLTEATAADTESSDSDVPALSHDESDDQVGSAASSDNATAKSHTIKTEDKSASSAPPSVYHDGPTDGTMPSKGYHAPYQTDTVNYGASYNNTPVYTNGVPAYAPHQVLYNGYWIPGNAVAFPPTENQVVNRQVQSLLSAGADPISEGRRVYIGNLKYTVSRGQVKKLLRHYGVYNTVEKIYMPYSDTPLESSDPDASPDHGSDYQQHYSHDDHDDDHHQRGADGTDLPNKGYVFVTYGSAAEATLAMERISGVMHLDRRLVCRPGLPKGTTFSQGVGGNESGNRNAWNRGKKRNYRREKTFNQIDNSYAGNGGSRQRQQQYKNYNSQQHYQPRRITGVDGDEFQQRSGMGGHRGGREFDDVNTYGYANAAGGGATFYTSYPPVAAFSYGGTVYYTSTAPPVVGPTVVGDVPQDRYSVNSGYRSNVPQGNWMAGQGNGAGAPAAGYDHHLRSTGNGGYRQHR